MVMMLVVQDGWRCFGALFYFRLRLARRSARPRVQRLAGYFQCGGGEVFPALQTAQGWR